MGLALAIDVGDLVGGLRSDKEFTKWSVGLTRLRTAGIESCLKLVLFRLWTRTRT